MRLPRAHVKINSHFQRTDRIVPFRKDIVFLERDLHHVLIGDLLSGLVLFTNEAGTDAQACFGFRLSDVVQDFLIGDERLASPVLWDFRKQAVLDGIPLG